MFLMEEFISQEMIVLVFFMPARRLKLYLSAEMGPCNSKVKIRDFPDYRYRGLYIEDKWGSDLMTLDDWKHLVDFMSEIKLNFLGVGVYGCWCIQHDNKITEFLMLPLENYPRLSTPQTITYYSPARAGYVTPGLPSSDV